MEPSLHSHCLFINSMSIIIINGGTMVSIYSSIVVINAFYRDSMYTQCLSMYLIVCLYLLFAKQMIHEVNLLKVCLQRFNVFYSISMSSPITPKGYIFPHDFPFFSLYPVTAAVKVPMHVSGLHHAGKEEIARLPTVRQGIFWEMPISSKGKKREKARLTLGRIAGSLQLHLVRIEWSIKLPLYI